MKILSDYEYNLLKNPIIPVADDKVNGHNAIYWFNEWYKSEMKYFYLRGRLEQLLKEEKELEEENK